MTGRAVSSVLDVTVCLLLISASAVALTQAPTLADRDHRDQYDRADSVLGTVTTTTAWVEYRSAAGNRTAHGPLADLAAAAAVSNATVHGDPLFPSTDGFRRAVSGAVRRALVSADVRVQVVARWRPYPDSHVRGWFAVGPSPPPSADVHAASTTVPWEPTDARERAVAVAPREGYAGVAREIADGLVRGPLLAAADQPAVRPADRSTARRRSAVAAAYGLDPSDTSTARVTGTVAQAVETDLRRGFDSPTDAARSVSVGEVRVTVRTWSP